MDPARVYIIEEHKAVRQALVERLSHAPNLQVIGNAGAAEDVIDDVCRMKPDIVLVEVKRSDGLGLEILRLISSMDEAPKVAVLTSYLSHWEKDASYRAGADSYLLKDIDPEELIRNISKLIRK